LKMNSDYIMKIERSSDLVNWVVLEENSMLSYYPPIFSHGTWFQLGSYGLLMTSTDGVEWNMNDEGLTGQFSFFDYAESIDQFVLQVDSSFFFSQDGLKWTNVSTIDVLNLQYSDGGYYVGLLNLDYTTLNMTVTKDFVNWFVYPQPDLPNDFYATSYSSFATYGNDMWIAVYSSYWYEEQLFFTSMDGFSWAEAASFNVGETRSTGPSTFGNGMLDIVSSDGFLYSTNVSLIEYGTQTPLYTWGTLIFLDAPGLDPGYAFFYLVQDNLYISLDGIAWTLLEFGFSLPPASGVTFSDMLPFTGFVVTDFNGDTWLSSDGITWDEGYTINTYTPFTGFKCSDTYCVAVSRYDNSIFTTDSN